MIQTRDTESRDPTTGQVVPPELLPKVFAILKEILNQRPSELYRILGPKSVQIELTNDCNLRCNMCDRWKWLDEGAARDMKGALTTVVVTGLMDQLKSLGTAHILFTGGEPLLRKDLPGILHHARQLGIAVSIITNGIPLTAELCQVIVETHTTMTFSVDASTRETYKKVRGRDLFETVLKNVRRLVAARGENEKPTIEMHFVIQKVNAREVGSYYNLCNDLDVDRVSYSIAHGPQIKGRGIGLDDNSYEVLKEQINHLPAGKSKPQVVVRDMLQQLVAGAIPLADAQAGLPVLGMFKREPVPCFSTAYWALIDAFGNVYPCCYTYHDNLSYHDYEGARSRFCFGNIHDERFADIWAGKKFNAFRSSTDPVEIDKFGTVCGQCGSYFFFKSVMEELVVLRDMVDSEQHSMMDILAHAQAWVDSLEAIDRSGKINIMENIMKMFEGQER